jgi:SOS response regulatory protein OraA/RecX
MQTEKNLQNE